MNPILVINAGCSSVKFQVFGIDGTRKLERLIKGEIDGIGTQPRLRAAAANGEDLIDQAFPPEHVADVPAALTITEDWLREIRNFEPIAVGLRAWRSNLRSAGFGRRRGPCRSRTLCFSGAPSPAKQPRAHPFASCKVSALPQVACFDMTFHRGHDAVVDHYAIPDRFYAEGVRRYGFHGLIRICGEPSGADGARNCSRARDHRASRERRFDVRTFGWAKHRMRCRARHRHAGHTRLAVAKYRLRKV
jgi:acetate kinase